MRMMMRMMKKDGGAMSDLHSRPPLPHPSPQLDIQSVSPVSANAVVTATRSFYQSIFISNMHLSCVVCILYNTMYI